MSTVPPDGPTQPAPEPQGPAVPPPDQPTAGAPATPPPPPGYGPPYGGPATPPPYAAAPPPAYGQPGYGQPYAPMPMNPSDERLWGTLSHIGGIITSFIAPLVIWLVFKERSRFVDDQAKEALNFQILVTIAYIVGGIFSFLIFPIVLIFAAWILTLVFGISGGIAANKGQAYRYPINWRIIK